MSAVLGGNPTTPPRPTPATLPASSGSVAAPRAEPTATERLNASRAKLREAMVEIAHPAPHRPSATSNAIHGISGEVFEMLRRLPGAAILLDSIEAWWSHHPLRTMGVVAEGATRSFLLPLLQRSPIIIVGVALVAGAAVVASKPWRWLLRPALFIGLVPQLLTQVMRRVPIETVVGLATSMLAKRRRRSAETRAKAKTAAVSNPVPNPSR